MRKKILRYLSPLLLIGALLVPSIVFADEITDVQQRYRLEDPMGGKTVPEIVSRIIQQVLPVVGALFLVMFIYGGVLWMTAGGSGEKVKKATQSMVNAAIGMTIVILAYTIVSAVIEKIGAVMGGAAGT